MKLLRLGDVGSEKPALIDSENKYRDLSSIINDLDPDTLNFETLENIKITDTSKLPLLDLNLRIGACVSKPSKFIGIGLNFKDHAEEQNLPIPKEPIIFSKLAQEIGLTAAQLAILWVKDQEGITAPLIGPRTLTHLENLLPVADMKLSNDIRIECDKLVPPGSVIANFHNTAEWMKSEIDWGIK